VIGKSLSARFGDLQRIDGASAIMATERALDERAREIVAVRAKGLLACVVIDADLRVVKALARLGLDMRLGGSAVFGLAAADVARSFAFLDDAARGWVSAPPALRETKILLFTTGYALLSVTSEGGQKTIALGPGA
jgi:hypothetical protein